MPQSRLVIAISATAAIMLAASIQSTPATAASNPVMIEHCFVTQPKMLSKNASGTQIVYVLKGAKTAKSITFVVGYRNAAQHFLRRITDVGTFVPGSTVDHHFDLYKDVTYAGKQTTACSAISVKWVDGTSWYAQ